MGGDYSIEWEHLVPIKGYLKYRDKTVESLKKEKGREVIYGVLTGSLGGAGIISWNGAIAIVSYAAIKGLETLLQ